MKAFHSLLLTCSKKISEPAYQISLTSIIVPRIAKIWTAYKDEMPVGLVSGLCSNFIGPTGRYEVLVIRRGS